MSNPAPISKPSSSCSSVSSSGRHARRPQLERVLFRHVKGVERRVVVVDGVVVVQHGRKDVLGLRGLGLDGGGVVDDVGAAARTSSETAGAIGSSVGSGAGRGAGSGRGSSAARGTVGGADGRAGGGAGGGARRRRGSAAPKATRRLESSVTSWPRHAPASR